MNIDFKVRGREDGSYALLAAKPPENGRSRRKWEEVGYVQRGEGESADSGRSRKGWSYYFLGDVSLVYKSKRDALEALQKVVLEMLSSEPEGEPEQGGPERPEDEPWEGETREAGPFPFDINRPVSHKLGYHDGEITSVERMEGDWRISARFPRHKCSLRGGVEDFAQEAA